MQRYFSPWYRISLLFKVSYRIEVRNSSIVTALKDSKISLKKLATVFFFLFVFYLNCIYATLVLFCNSVFAMKTWH